MNRPRRSGDTRQRLLEEGTSALLEHGYHGAGLKEILDRCGVPKGSFYHYFESKERYCAEIIEHFSTRLIARLDEAEEAANSNAEAALRGFFGGAAERHRDAGYTGGCLLGNLAAEVEDMGCCRTSLGDAFRAWQEKLATILRLAQQQGSVRADMDALVLARLVLDAWEGASLRMKIEGSGEPLRQFMECVFDGYLRCDRRSPT